jgi:hypothetical protein
MDEGWNDKDTERCAGMGDKRVRERKSLQSKERHGDRKKYVGCMRGVGYHVLRMEH